MKYGIRAVTVMVKTFLSLGVGLFRSACGYLLLFTRSSLLFFRETPGFLISLFDIHPAFGILAYGAIGWMAGWVIRATDRLKTTQ